MWCAGHLCINISLFLVEPLNPCMCVTQMRKYQSFYDWPYWSMAPCMFILSCIDTFIYQYHHIFFDWATDQCYIHVLCHVWVDFSSLLFTPIFMIMFYGYTCAYGHICGSSHALNLTLLAVPLFFSRLASSNAIDVLWYELSWIVYCFRFSRGTKWPSIGLPIHWREGEVYFLTQGFTSPFILSWKSF